jgi:hypothetical protein
VPSSFSFNRGRPNPSERRRTLLFKARDKQAVRRPDHFVPSRPENIAWGWFPLDNPTVLTIRSGETVRIDTLTGSGATGTPTPEEFFAPFGVQPGEILPDVFDFWRVRAGAGGPPPDLARGVAAIC